MDTANFSVVTGSFGYSGKYITRRLLSKGEKVVTLTGHPNRQNPFGELVRAHPYNFDHPQALAKTLEGASTLYNTYWIRFNYKQLTYDKAVENTNTLIKATKLAGVKRIVHISISNPSYESHLPYFRGKALLEDEIQKSGLSYGIIRPTVIFGKEDILINNIAYLLRRSPVFIIPGLGDYRLQPIYVEDLALIAVDVGHRNENLTIDAAGPEIFTYNQLIHLIAAAINSSAKIIHLPHQAAYLLSRLVGIVMNDILLTRDEISGLITNLLISNNHPIGTTSLRSWLDKNSGDLGRKYKSELAQHYT